jgi:hypothetical protein
VFESTDAPPTLSVPDSVSSVPVIVVKVDAPVTFNNPPSVVPPLTVSGPPVTFNDPIIVVLESTLEPVTFNDPVTVVLLNPIVVLLILAVARVTFIVPVIVLPIVISLLVEIVLGFA